MAQNSLRVLCPLCDPLCPQHFSTTRNQALRNQNPKTPGNLKQHLAIVHGYNDIKDFEAKNVAEVFHYRMDSNNTLKAIISHKQRVFSACNCGKPKEIPKNWKKKPVLQSLASDHAEPLATTHDMHNERHELDDPGTIEEEIEESSLLDDLGCDLSSTEKESGILAEEFSSSSKSSSSKKLSEETIVVKDIEELAMTFKKKLNARSIFLSTIDARHRRFKRLEEERSKEIKIDQVKLFSGILRLRNRNIAKAIFSPEFCKSHEIDIAKSTCRSKISENRDF